AQTLAHEFGNGVDAEGEQEQHEGGQEQDAVMGTAHRRLGHFHRDVGGQGAHALKDVHIHDRRVAGGHEHDHGLAHGTTHADHYRRENSGAGGGQHDAGHGLPSGGAQRQGAVAEVFGHAEYGVLGDGEDGGNHRKAHGRAHHQGVALIKAKAKFVAQPEAHVAAEEPDFDV